MKSMLKKAGAAALAAALLSGIPASSGVADAFTSAFTAEATETEPIGFDNPFDNITFSHTINLSNTLGIVYYIPAYAFEGMSDVKLTVTKETYIDNVFDLKSTVLRPYAIEDSGNGKEYVFRYEGLAAKEMASMVYAVASGTRNGTTYQSDTDMYSIKQYAMNKLHNSDDPKLKGLLVDMLQYGTQAQFYFNYNMGVFASDKLTLAESKLGASFNANMLRNDASETILPGAKARFTGKTLNLGNTISIVYFMELDSNVNKNNVKLRLSYKTVTGTDKTVDIPYSKFRKGDYPNELRCDFSGLAAKDSLQPVTAAIYEGNKQISNEIVYSIPTYCYKKYHNENTSSELINMIYFLITYCSSAKDYFTQ